ncbi:MAG TPA: hypothetical protein VKT72_07355 [Candidatus Baltobacteraceae bacterium]|nr:hypothetical protein [Candidatus Baltobacteraceae bacterium]
MSFTPDTPTGFDPCGIAFGEVRIPYSAPCGFFADSSGLDNRINWYIVDDDTPTYDGLTAFWPRVDVPNDEAHTLYEKEGDEYARIKSWYLAFVPPLPPHGVHGDSDDFMGVSLKAKYEIDGDPPDAPCAVVRVWPAGQALFAQLVREIPVMRGGCRVNGVRVLAAYRVMTAGLALGALLIVPPKRMQAGLRLGALRVKLPPVPMTGGLQLGALVIPMVRVQHGGVRLGGKIASTDAGIQLGASISQPSIRVYSAGVRVGGSLSRPAVEPFTAGVQLGVIKLRNPESGLMTGARIDPVIPRLTAGFSMGDAETIDPELLIPTALSGIENGGSVVPDLLSYDAGLQMGGSVTQLVRTFTAGVQLGATRV